MGEHSLHSKIIYISGIQPGTPGVSHWKIKELCVVFVSPGKYNILAGAVTFLRLLVESSIMLITFRLLLPNVQNCVARMGKTLR